MRALAVAIVLLCAASASSAAHGTSSLPEPGHVDLSLQWVLTSGLQVSIMVVQNEDHELIGYAFHELVTRYNAGVPGLDSMIEVGLLPWLSAGLQLSFPQFLLNGLQGGSYALTAATFVSLQWYRGARLGLQTRIEVEADPLFGPAEGLVFDQGFYNLYVTFLGTSLVLTRRDNNALWLYADAKAVTSFENPAYRTPESAFESLMMLPPGSTEGLPHETGPMCKVVMSPGIEWRLRWFIARVGFNIPVLTFTRYRIGKPFDFYDVDLTNLEFAWRFRL